MFLTFPRSPTDGGQAPFASPLSLLSPESKTATALKKRGDEEKEEEEEEEKEQEEEVVVGWRRRSSGLPYSLTSQESDQREWGQRGNPQARKVGDMTTFNPPRRPDSGSPDACHLGGKTRRKCCHPKDNRNQRRRREGGNGQGVRQGERMINE